jgi:hypothetical protein
LKENIYIEIKLKLLPKGMNGWGIKLEALGGNGYI